MVAQPSDYISEEEYLALERASEVRHEYYLGKMVAMAGASERHGAIIGGTYFHLYGQLRGGPCRAYTTDLRVRVSATGLYTYPDIVVVCGERQLTDNHRDTLLNPTAVIEVLSPATEGYDRGRKFRQYQSIPSLREYLLIAQEVPLVEHFVRQDDGQWLYSAADGLEATVELPSLGCSLALANIYELVDWES
jgi:Uma2 family endonuclease